MVAGVFPATTAAAQDVRLSPLLSASRGTCLLPHAGLMLMGLEQGGLAVWDRAAFDQPPQRVTAGDQLSHNRVVDLAGTPLHVWVATAGGGLTRIGDLEGAQEYRQFVTGLGGRDLTAVGAGMIGGSEWVFYAMAGAGVGRIVGGVPGAVYTAEQDGLVSNTVNTIVFRGDEVFFGTPDGVSRFAGNVFTTINDGLSNLWIEDLAVDGSGRLVAAGRGGVYRYDDAGGVWSLLTTIGSWATALAPDGDDLWVLGWPGQGDLVRVTGAGAVEAVAMPEPLVYALAMADGALWATGRWRAEGMSVESGLAFLGRRADGVWAVQVMNATLVRNADGAAIDESGHVWLGSRTGKALSRWTGEMWTNHFEVADAGSEGLFNHVGGMLAVGAELGGAAWAGQFDAGLVRLVPADRAGSGEDEYNRVSPTNAPLQGRNYERAVTHPAGPVIFLSAVHGADILVTPSGWSDPGAWVNVTANELNGVAAIDVLVERPDVLWFAVADVGLVRWDVNGSAAGSAAPLTWTDPTDDVWSQPVTSVEGFDVTQVSALALGRDGTIWAGGSGVVCFTYVGQTFPAATLVAQYDRKGSGFEVGLLAQAVADVAVDRNGDLWVLTGAGLNRVRRRDDGTTIDAYTNLTTFLANPDFGSLYSPNIISAFPGGVGSDVYELTAGRDGRRLVATTSVGAVLVEVDEQRIEQPAALDGMFVYPNPFPGQGDGDLFVGGIAADRADPATVEIYTLDGELVYRNRYVAAEVSFWDGRNRLGEAVASGIYLMRVRYAGAQRVHQLAVER
ncbi:MAG: T9SS type A sorting domain-containing protein [Candidatus Krumholzibacteriia bacterium]